MTGRGGADRAPGAGTPAAPILRFLGGAGTVTGSKLLVDTGDAQVLVDCGLFQGTKELRLRNWDPLPVDPAGIDAVVLTHAHLDHCGYLPALCRSGFRGAVHCTRSTAALAPIVMTDAGRLQEEEAGYANRKRFSKHRPALPLFTEHDAERASERLRPVAFGHLVSSRHSHPPATSWGRRRCRSRSRPAVGGCSSAATWGAPSTRSSARPGRRRQPTSW
jgi:glyoxylase-like metal-dependent hydrolase (beta-lactamase superfamily II)